MPATVLEPNTPAPATSAPSSGAPGTAGPGAAGYALALLRILLGMVLVWAFVDKAFGLGFATPAAKSWTAGGSPTAGYLGSLKGWLAGAFQPLAGHPVVDVSFMLALLLVGAALVLGIALKAAALGGTALMMLMWLTALPIKTNPVLDQHIIYALAMIALAATGAGRVWGFGHRWSSLLKSAPAPVRSVLA